MKFYEVATCDLSPEEQKDYNNNNSTYTAVREFEKGMCALSSLNERVNACIRKEIDGDKVEKGESPDFWETNLVSHQEIIEDLYRRVLSYRIILKSTTCYTMLRFYYPR